MEGAALKSNQFLGLFKFFRDEEYLDKLIAGCMHCQTPETYRIHKDEGVSDRAESCMYSWRASRGDSTIEVSLNDYTAPPEDVMALTIHRGDAIESWLHCWFALRLPADADALQALRSDLSKMKKEFGRNYAYIQPRNVRPFIAKLKAASEKPLWCGEIDYSGAADRWDATCKSAAYSYQREYRFGFGTCGISETEPYVFHHPDGFADLILKNPDFALTDSRDDGVLLDLQSL